MEWEETEAAEARWRNYCRVEMAETSHMEQEATEEEGRQRWSEEVEWREAAARWAEEEQRRASEEGHRAAVAEAQVDLAEEELEVVTGQRDWAEEVNERNYGASQRLVARLMERWNRSANDDLRLWNQALDRAEVAERRVVAAEWRAEAAERRAAAAERRAAAASAAAAAAVAQLGTIVVEDSE